MKEKELTEKYHGQWITCPICGETGRLCFKVKGSNPKRYFYCRHGSDTCYIGRIEDIEELLDPSLTIEEIEFLQKHSPEQATLV